MFDIKAAAERFSKNYAIWDDEARALIWQAFPVSTPVFMYVFMGEVEVKPGGQLALILEESYNAIYNGEDPEYPDAVDLEEYNV